MTQRQLAEKVGVTTSAVSLWESGRTAPSLAHLAHVVVALRLTMSAFYGAPPKAAA